MTITQQGILDESERDGWPRILRIVAKAAKRYNPCEADGKNGLAIFDGIHDHLVHAAQRLEVCAQGLPDPADANPPREPVQITREQRAEFQRYADDERNACEQRLRSEAFRRFGAAGLDLAY